MVTLPPSGYISSHARTQGEAQQYFEDIQQFLEDRLGRDSSILARSKNLFINGNFDLWQRGTSFPTIAGDKIYGPDRWNHRHFGTPGSSTVSRQAFTLGQTDVPGEPKYFYRMVTTTKASVDIRVLVQDVESVRSLAGQTCTVSFYAKADAAQGFRSVMEQNFGTGGAPSASVFSGQDWTISTAWAPYSFTWDLASISSKTVGDNGDDFLSFQINDTGSNATYTIDIAQVQLEPGSGATPFDARQPGEEYDLAARYYVKSYDIDVVPGTTGDLNGALHYHALLAGVNRYTFPVYLPVKMRASPSLTFYNPNAGGTQNLWRNRTGNADSGTAGSFGLSETGFMASNPQVLGDSVGDEMAIHWTLQAEL